MEDHMKKKIAIGGVLAGLFFAGAWMQSRESQLKGAVYSTPVSVVNTSANPGGVLDAGEASRVPYRSTVAQVCGQNQIYTCGFTFSAIPAGYRLVIQTVGAVLKRRNWNRRYGEPPNAGWLHLCGVDAEHPH